MASCLSSVRREFTSRPGSSPSPPIGRGCGISKIREIGNRIMFAVIAVLRPNRPFGRSSVYICKRTASEGVQSRVRTGHGDHGLCSEGGGGKRTRARGSGRRARSGDLTFVSNVSSVSSHHTTVISVIADGHVGGGSVSLAGISREAEQHIIRGLESTRASSLHPSSVMRGRLGSTRSRSGTALVGGVVRLCPDTFSEEGGPRFGRRPGAPRRTRFVIVS